ncbi:hypothetical protein TSUD_72780 [Trifolium subterraneum]|uniref:Uncharacterized protein n=1 Tax=Trifolium subterraneum TaxID=3900 RepID=A0A2Z6LV56_TRISU|nr:hypothetical protein TSUD_72780 [Trifolium subterraneum]
MGLTFRVPSHQPSNSSKRNINSIAPDTVVAKRRRRWWHFCTHADARSASFLEVERRLGDADFYVEGLVMVDSQQQRTSGRELFADGRVLPPSAVHDGPPTAGSLCSRFPVSLTGICSGGAG